jgi:hypothetical protein
MPEKLGKQYALKKLSQINIKGKVKEFSCQAKVEMSYLYQNRNVRF